MWVGGGVVGWVEVNRINERMSKYVGEMTVVVVAALAMVVAVVMVVVVVMALVMIGGLVDIGGE